MVAMSDCTRLYPLRILSRKWSYIVLRVLQEPHTFSELQRELKFITNHILTRELKLLQQENVIANDGKYHLTPEGKALVEAVETLVAWSVKHGGKSPCPPSRKCATCFNYPNAVGARSFVTIGKRQNA